MLNSEIVRGDSIIDDFTEFGAFFSFDFKADEAKIEFDDFVEFDNVFGANKFVDTIDDHAEARIFADTRDVEKIGTRTRNGATTEAKSDDFEGVRIDNEVDDLADSTASLHAKNGGADEFACIN